MKVIKIFIVLIHILLINCYYKILRQEEFYNNVRGVKLGKDTYIEIIDNFKKIIKYYVNIDVLKNPPQPDFDDNYYQRIDTMEYLDEMKRNINDETNSYDFYRNIKLLIDSYKDAHMTYGLRGFNYANYIILSPIKLSTKINNTNNEAYSICESQFDETYFRNGTEIFKLIERNKDQPIKYINGKTPFEFIQSFGNPFMQLKNDHATYTFKSHEYLSAFVLYFPLNSEDISNFTVEYENGDIFETDLAIAEIVYDNLNKNYYQFFDNDILEKEFMKYLEIKFKDDKYGTPKGLNEMLTDFKQLKKLLGHNKLLSKKNNFLDKNLLTESEYKDIEWDYEYTKDGVNSFQCRVDKEKEINVYHLTTFQYNDEDLAYDILKNCTELFSTNDYNIIVILNYNGGGIIQFAHTMVEYLQPYISSRFYVTLKQGEYLSKYYDIDFKDWSIKETCKTPEKDYLLKNTISIDYDNIINNITYPFIAFGHLRKEFNEFKNKIKNKRKPTEILIFTDSYSASSASLFCKSLQYEGGAIIAGYNSNPKINKTFDSSQHLSFIIKWKDLKQLEEEATTRLEELGIRFSQIPIMNIHFNYNNLKLPEEFNIMPVDEVTNIYESFDENKNYDLFIDVGKKILDNYKTKCNINNKKLTLFSEECKFYNDKYAHGGYSCGEDSKWNKNKCIPIYCENDYFFDNNENKCIKDPCIEEEKIEDNSYMIAIKNSLLISILILMI